MVKGIGAGKESSLVFGFPSRLKLRKTVTFGGTTVASSMPSSYSA